MKNPFRYSKTSPGIIRLAVMMYVRFPLSLRNVEDLRKLMKRYPRPDAIIMDRLKSYRAALRELGGSGRHQAGRWRNNRAENSHLPFRRREHAMLRFRRMRSLQKFAAVHSSVYKPLQPATIPLLTGQFQAQPRRCTCPVASTRGGLIPYRQWRTQTCGFPLTVPFESMGLTDDQLLAKLEQERDTLQAELDARKAKLDARTRRVRSRLSARERKADTRRKILVGAMMLKAADQYPKTKDFMLRNLDDFLEHPRDRELFGLAPKQGER